MRTARIAIVASLTVVASSAAAQDAAAPAFLNSIDFGVRGTSFDDGSDRARLRRYRDLRNGPFVDRVQLVRETDRWRVDFRGDHVGYRDGRYVFDYTRYGGIRFSGEWDQTPLFYSRDTESLYTDQGGGQLRIANTAVRSSIQGGTLTVANVRAFLGPNFELQQRRDVAAFRFVAPVKTDIDLRVNFTSTRKSGEMPWGAALGFSPANEVAAPIDHRTNDVGASLEWANSRGMLRIGYDGSWFTNSIPTLVFDSPVRATDSLTAGSSQGRTAMWPDNMANTLSVAAAYKLPGRSRLNGSVSVSDWRQNAALLPFTINSAITPIPLDRQTADAEAVITSYNVNFTSRPFEKIWFNVRSRLYDYNNNTPEFRVSSYVRTDQAVTASAIGHTEPFGYVRHYFDADASYSLMPFTALKVGYGLEKVDRTFRYFDSTTEHTFRAAIDTTGYQYAMVRLGYEHSKRSGTGFDEEALDEIGEQVSLRQFDISDRNRERVTALIQATPIGQLALIASAQTGRDTRPDALFGLRKSDTNGYSLGFDATPTEMVGFGLTYSYEDAKTNQKSRQANPGAQFNDPTRDWFTDMRERVHYVVANIDVLGAVPRSEVRLAYDWNQSTANYFYTLAPNTTLPAVTQLPAVLNELRRASVDVRYSLTSRLTASVMYAYESYAVDDFQMSPQYAIGNRTLADGIMLGSFMRPYRAHVGWLRMVYRW